MPVHPQIQKALDALAEAGLPAIEDLTPEAARAQMSAMARARGGAPKPIRAVEDRTIPGPARPIPIRVYRPLADRPVGAMLYFHGGGHVIGDLDTHDTICRNLTAGSDAVVVSVDYRMGPEHRFPAAVDDSWAALAWLHGARDELGVGAGRIAVAGDSAGGNLAAVVALMARDAGGPEIAYQALVYPVGDYRFTGASYAAYGQGYGVLTAKTMEWFRDHYLAAPADAEDWRASPQLAKDFGGLPPALVITAECDVLHDDGAAYARALIAAGVATEYREFPGMIHAFFGMTPVVDAAAEAQALVARRVREALAGAA